MYEIMLASRSSDNESESKGVYGAIVESGSDVIVCYVPNQRQATKVLAILNSR